jgi:hypothetical protein
VRAKVREEETATREEKAAEFRERYGLRVVPDRIAERVWNLAWEDGHASGYWQVEEFYADYAELVLAVREATIREALG